MVGDLPWGSHFCLFYQTKKDLVGVIAPYLLAGLDNNEFCLWIVSVLSMEDARDALIEADSAFGKYLSSGQLEIVSPTRPGGEDLEPGGLIISKLDHSVLAGLDGLRLVYDAVPGPPGNETPIPFGDDVVTRLNAIAMLTYDREGFDAAGLMELVKNHAFALVGAADRWEVLESTEARATKALQRSEAKLQTLFSNMSEGFAYHRIILDAGGTPCDYVFLETNRAFEKLTGLGREDLIGKRVTEVIPGIENDPTDWIGKYGAVALTGQPIQFESYSEPLEKWYSVSAFSSNKGFFAVTFDDISVRKRAEQELKLALASLEESNEELQRFAYVASHDMQEPLRTVSTYMQLLEQRYAEKIDADATEFIAFAVDASNRMRLMIDDLLTYSRIGIQGKDFEKVDLGLIYDRVTGDLMASIDSNQAEITRGFLPQVTADPSQMIQLMQNLIGNAIKFRGSQPPKIHVEAENIGDEWVFCVSDNGIGIEPEYSERIFVIFQRLQDRTQYPGTGIGLSICKRIVERHEGKIWVESQPGKGARFFFTLPAG